MITNIRFTNSLFTAIEILYDSGMRRNTSDPVSSNLEAEVQAWLDEGNIIAVFDIYHGVPDADLKEFRYIDNATYAQLQVDIAEANPIIGVDLDERNAKKENERRLNRAKGKLRLTDADDALSDHIDSIMDSLDLADDGVEALSVRQDIIDWVPTNVTWPIWVAPIV